MIMIKLFQKITTTASDQHTIRLAAIAQLDRDLDAAIDAALSAGVAFHTVVETLERKENAARHRMAASLRSNVSWRSVQELSRFGVTGK
jgi:hypothetical protein